MTKQEIKETEDKIIAMARAFCAQYLDEEYSQLCEKLTRKLGRKRDVPFQRGKAEIWAAAVVYSIGSINFLFDKSFEPFSTPAQISEYFGTKNSSVSNKAREIKDLFNLEYFSPEFTTQKIAQGNPFNNLAMVNGLIVPISQNPDDANRVMREEPKKEKPKKAITAKEAPPQDMTDRNQLSLFGD